MFFFLIPVKLRSILSFCLHKNFASFKKNKSGVVFTKKYL